MLRSVRPTLTDDESTVLDVEPAPKRQDIIALKRQIRANDSAIGDLVQAASHLSSQIVDLRQGQLDIKSGQVEVQRSQHELRQEFNGRIDAQNLQFNSFVRTSVTNAFKSGLRGQFLPYLHLGFDGSSGNNFYCQVSLTDHTGADRDLVCFSIPSATRFYGVECPQKIPMETTQSFFLSPEFIRAGGLNYKDIINGLMLTGFGFLAVGPKWNQMRMRNTARFVFVEAAFARKLLDDIDEHMPDRPRVRRDLTHGGTTPNYKLDGNDFGFRQQSRTDKSTGHIIQVRQTIPYERKKMMPMLGEPWVREWYTPGVAKFFRIPEEEIGVHHVVGSVLDPNSAIVKTHAQGFADFRQRVYNAKYKKSKSKNFKLKIV